MTDRASDDDECHCALCQGAREMDEAAERDATGVVVAFTGRVTWPAPTVGQTGERG